jgi:hypothetical protein
MMPSNEKQQCTESLILSGGGDALFDGQMSEEFGHLALAHFAWMALLVKEDVAATPIDVRLFSADRIMFHPQMPADAIE